MKFVLFFTLMQYPQAGPEPTLAAPIAISSFSAEFDSEAACTKAGEDFSHGLPNTQTTRWACYSKS